MMAYWNCNGFMSSLLNSILVWGLLNSIRQTVHFGFVSWSETFRMKIESSGMLANSPSSKWYEDAIARTEPSVLNDSEDMLDGYLRNTRTQQSQPVKVWNFH